MNVKTGSLIQTILGLPIFRSEWVLYLLLILSIASIGVDCAATDLTKGAAASAPAPNRKERRNRLIMGVLFLIHVKARR